MKRPMITDSYFRSGNATTNDLWSALSKASGQDVHGFMVSVKGIDLHSKRLER
jgi:Aminopeptidase N